MAVVFGPILVAREGLSLARLGPNPGVGGTEFQTGQLAFELAARGLLDNIHLLQVRNGFRIGASRLDHSVVATFDTVAMSPRNLVVAPVLSLERLQRGALAGNHVIAHSHHPHDWKLRKVCADHDVQAVVSVGRYAFRSNQEFVSVPHYWVPNLFSPEAGASNYRRQPSSREPFIVGHMSSLNPVKGFLHVARAWPEIVRKFPHATLEVIGGESLWGLSEEDHPLLPTSVRFGEEILSALGVSLGSVRFLGRIDGGVDSITRRWMLSILNPTGDSEADPASFKDMVRAGVPTIAGYGFGLQDYLYDFPRLRILDPNEVAGKAIEMLKSRRLRQRIHRQFVDLSQRLSRQNDSILRWWVGFLKEQEQTAGFLPQRV